MFNSTPSFSLDCFEGPLELLLFLIQKEEVDLYDVSLKTLTTQVMQLLEKEGIDTSAESLNLASTFLLMKSQKLLPGEAIADGEEGEKPLEMLQKLIEYCRFRDTASLLSTREEKQLAYFPRGSEPFRKELGSGLEEVGIDDLKKLLFEAVAKTAKSPVKMISQEPWQVETKIHWFQKTLSDVEKMTFQEAFSEHQSVEELICTFLALLELMKQQFLKVVRENDLHYIILYGART